MGRPRDGQPGVGTPVDEHSPGSDANRHQRAAKLRFRSTVLAQVVISIGSAGALIPLVTFRGGLRHLSVRICVIYCANRTGFGALRPTIEGNRRWLVVHVALSSS